MSAINIHCPHCQLMNRLQTARLSSTPQCVRCNMPLLQGKPIVASEINLTGLINAELPVLVQFWAPWCSACMNFEATYEAVSLAVAEVCFVKVDIHAHVQLAKQYKIRTIPTMILFKQGIVLDNLHDALPKPAFRDWLTHALSKATT